MIRKLKIFGLDLQLSSLEILLKEVFNHIKNRNRLNIIACDFRDVLYFKDNKINEFSHDSIFYPDSTGIYLLIKFLFPNSAEGFKKIVSTDFHYNLLDECIKKKSLAKNSYGCFVDYGWEGVNLFLFKRV